MTTMAESNMRRSKARWSRIIAAKVVAAAFAAPLAKIAFLTIAAPGLTLALHAGAASAAEQLGQPGSLEGRKVAAMVAPGTVTYQMSTPVTGVMAPSETAPLAGHELHFQNRLSGNLYTLRTKSNGAFSTMLPPGVYDLRGIHGAVIASGVVVGQMPIDLGQVNSPSPYNPWRLIERQQLGPAIVKSPAPATAYLPGAGGIAQPISGTTMVNPSVIGGGANGQPLAPAVVMPARTSEQTEIPAGAQAPNPGMPPAPSMAAPPGGGY
jgi:hypothetical protein